jgi:hypothetical protein
MMDVRQKESAKKRAHRRAGVAERKAWLHASSIERLLERADVKSSASYDPTGRLCWVKIAGAGRIGVTSNGEIVLRYDGKPTLSIRASCDVKKKIAMVLGRYRSDLCRAEAYRHNGKRRRRVGIVGEREMQAAEYWLSVATDVSTEPRELFEAELKRHGERVRPDAAALPRQDMRQEDLEGLVLLAWSESLGDALHTEPREHFKRDARRARARAASRDIRRDREAARRRDAAAAYGEALAIQAMGEAWFVDKRHPSEW